ncbi:MAG: YbaB/EbfC family nucleoid-associated protein [Proteobacteria bacterium]|nr:YbaB/EbfC family nucleoid-associated protein [Pseudomonadota bacterium]MBU1688353.1 YbaB/EbfC family nucleoid-associated protein [Pseudomonadota bacterium]
MDLQQLMRQAQEFQQKMKGMQDELAGRTVNSTVGGGMVRATVNGNQELVDLVIEPGVIDPSDPTMLQDLIAAAINDALKQSRELARTEMGRLTGGLNIPGLF